MNEPTITLRLFDHQLNSDRLALDKLWGEYDEFFSLEKTQPDYHKDFMGELNSLKEMEIPGKRLYFFENASSSSSVVGMSMLCATAELKVCEIKKVLISKDFRGKGYGKIAMDLLCDSAKKHGYQKCKLDVLETKSQAASAVYKSVGFEVCNGEMLNTENDVVFMEKSLV